MPTYEYQCDACEHAFEEFQKITDDPLVKCPQCNKRKLRRLFGTGAAIVFKGSGFYQTDYRSDSYQKAAASDKPTTDNSAPDKAGSSTKQESASSTTADATSPATDSSAKPKPKARRKSSGGDQG